MELSKLKEMNFKNFKIKDFKLKDINIKNIIEKYKEDYKKKKELNQRVNFVLNSEFDYKDHDINILKACLNAWTKNNYIDIPFKYEWIYTDPKQKQKMYFVSSSISELRTHKLEKILENPELHATSYMNSYFSSALFSPWDLSKRNIFGFEE